MAGVEGLTVVRHPLADDEAPSGAGILQQSADTLQSYGVTPEATLISAGVGLLLSGGLMGVLKGAALGSLLSLAYNSLKNR